MHFNKLYNHNLWSVYIVGKTCCCFHIYPFTYPSIPFRSLCQFFSVFIKISINDNVGFSHFYMTDQFWQCRFFPVFSVQVVFEFVNVSKIFVEMLYGYITSYYMWPNNFLLWNGFADGNMESGKLHKICLQISVIQWC